MVKKLFIYIFIYTLLVGCDTRITQPGTETDYFLEVTAPSLELDENGYYHIEFLDNYLQTFSTLDANTGSEDMYQKVYWDSDSGIYESYTGDWVSCVNHASYTSYGVAHTVLSVWEENIGDTVTVYTWYKETTTGTEFIDSIGVVIDNEVQNR